MTLGTISSDRTSSDLISSALINSDLITSGIGLSIIGTESGERIFGSSSDDAIQGLGGPDRINGGSGRDNLAGGTGNDVLTGGDGNDLLFGEADSDSLSGGAGADALDGGSGYDTASYASSVAVTVELGYQGFGGDAQGDTYTSIENVFGSIFNDNLIGDSGNNILNGYRGHDQLTGGAGRDILIGGADMDTLSGDTAGVYNNDVFIIQRFSGADSSPGYNAHDTITDFQIGYDKVALSGYSLSDFGSDGKLGSGILYEDGIIEATESLDATDKLYLDYGTLYECEIQMIDGEAHLISRQAVVTFGIGIGTYPFTNDFVFVEGDVVQYASALQASYVDFSFPAGIATLYTDGVLAKDIAGDHADDVMFQNSLDGTVYYAKMSDGAFAGWGAATGALGTDFKAFGLGNVNPGTAGGAEVFVQQQSTGTIYYASVDNGATTWGVVSASLTPDWKGRAIADLNGDGSADVVVQNQADGTIYFADMQGGSLHGWGVVSANLDSSWKVAGAADINADGFADVVVQQQGTGTTYYADMANGAFAGWGLVSANLTADWEVKAVGDVTGDGFADVLFQQASTGTTYYADMAHGAFDHWGVAASNIDTSWQAAGLADVDHDSDLDVLFQHTTDGATLYAEMGPDGFVGEWGVVTTSVNTAWHVV